MFTDEIRSRFVRSQELFRELVASIAEPVLAESLPGLPSNSIGAQLWCVVGARESYGRAIEAGEWSGFACSLSGESTHVRDRVLAALEASSARLLEIFDAVEWSAATCALALDCLEHEASHQGQLIRYLYGLDLEIPPSWQDRYALTPRR